MSRRPRESGMLSNPVLIGALTVLATIVAVLLAYNANNGLPFVPTYSLHVDAPNADQLTHGAEVHMGGSLVGAVTSIDASRNASGTPIAVLNLKLQKSIEPLPVDSTFDIRLKASIGLKYLQVTPGTSTRTLPNGATVPVSQTSAEVDLDQFLDMFNPPTRVGVAAQTAGYAEGLAGRGSDLNDAIHAFVPLVTDLGPVMQNLASPKTDFGGFWRGIERFTAALVPVAQAQADLYRNLDTTFKAFASVAVPYLQDWISQTPPTLSATIADSPTLQTFLTDTAALFSELRPGFATLPSSAPVLADTFAIGARNLPGTSALDQRTVSLARKLQSFGQTPAVQQGLDRLTLTLSDLRSPLQFLAPVQDPCNYVTLFLKNTQSTFSDNVFDGTALRFIPVAIPQITGAESVPSSHLYTAPGTTIPNPYNPGVPSPVGPVNADPYPNTDSPGETPECSAGNETYNANGWIGNPPTNVGLKTVGQLSSKTAGHK